MSWKLIPKIQRNEETKIWLLQLSADGCYPRKGKIKLGSGVPVESSGTEFNKFISEEHLQKLF